MVFDRLADRAIRSAASSACRRSRPRPASSVGSRPMSRDKLFAFALCYSCPTDDSEDFHERFLAAIGGKGARDIAAGTA